MTCNQDLGLPEPEPYTGERFDVRDYPLRYPEAETIQEAAEMRGFDAFLQDLKPDDFMDALGPSTQLLGTATLWAQSTWAPYLGERNVELERAMAGVKVGDTLEARACSTYINERGYEFYRPDGTLLPFEPYHDYDDIFFEQSLDDTAPDEKLICRVTRTTCNGEDGIPQDPSFCWRVYSCKVTVYRAR